MRTRIFKGGQSLLALHEQHPSRYPFLLESVSTSAHARYSLLLAFPGTSLVLNSPDEANFCERLDALWRTTANTVTDDTCSEAQNLPFRGGWFLYLGYELAGQLEPSLCLPAESQGLPLALAVRIPAAIIVDHQCNVTTVMAETGFDTEFERLCADIVNQRQVTAVAREVTSKPLMLTEDPPIHFTTGVERIRRYIAAGDVFQANLSRAWQGKPEASATPAGLYRRLCQTNPAPFACCTDFGGFAIISSSPERLVRVHQGAVETRPIAGTRPRGDDPERDRELLEELIAHPKERAEHIMLIDLERNDLGRICEYGTVEVDELMAVESYQHVHHIVSNVRGQLREGVTPGQVIRATFPGGTITGCPKVRCMEIIAELEQTGRGAYTGSAGYLNHNGDMDLNILIRTMTLKDGQLSFRTGAGIVMDSVPANELRETLHKARGLLRALGRDLG